MSFTVQSVVDQAFAKSASARPEAMVSSTAFIDRIGQCLREWFQVMSRENPYLLVKSGSMPFNGTGWSRPSDALRVMKVSADAGTIATPALSVGARIWVVPFDDQRFAQGMPSVTEWGQQFVSTGQTMDPSAGTLTCWYARTPVMPTLTTSTIDALFPDMFQDFLNYDLAAYMASDDSRDADEQRFLAFKNAQLQLSIGWAEQQTYSVAQRFPLVTPPLTNQGGGQQPGTGTPA